MNFNIYLARPITGMTGEEVVGYYDKMRSILMNEGYKVLQPMTGKGYLRTEVKFKAEGFTNPVSTNHAIIERDRWMVHQADVVFVNLEGAKSVSIGCMMELAWAHDHGKHTVVLMEKENVHRHAFVIEASDVIFNNMADLLVYMQKLARQEA